MAKKTKQPDDEIFDLTELIEAGAGGSKNAAAAYARAAEPVKDEGPLDFDSMLSDAEGSEKARPASSRPVDPNEELDMSDLGEIDNILESLNIPPQPGENAASQAKSPPSPASPADDLDSVLDDLLGDPGPATQATEKTVDATQKPKTAPASDLDVDLDNILASIDEPDLTPPGSPGQERQAAPPDAKEDDINSGLDDLLGESFAETPTSSANTDFDLPKDMDKLLDEPASRPKSAGGGSKSQAQSADGKTMGSADNVSPVFAQQTPEQPSSISQDAITGICHNILMSQMGPLQDTLQNISRQLGAQSAHFDDLSHTVADISKRLFATESKLTAAKNRISALESTVSSQTSFEDFFKEGSALHAGFMKLIAASVTNAVRGIAEKLSPGGANYEQLEQMLTSQGENLQRLENLEKRLDALEPFMKESLEKTNSAISALKASLDAATLENEQAAKLEARLDSLEPILMARLDETQNHLSALQDSLGSTKVDEGRLEKLEGRLDILEPSLSARLDQSDAALSTLQASLGAASAEDGRLEKLEARLGSLEPSLIARLDQSDAALSALQASLGAASAEDGGLEKLEARLDSLEPSLIARLDQSDAALSALQASLGAASAEDGRLEKLEARLEDIQSTIKDRLDEITASFASLQASLPDQAVQENGDMESRIEIIEKKLASIQPNLGEKLERLFKTDQDNGKKLDKLLKADRGVQARMDSLETRLDQLEPNFNIQVEKAAASAVVRILHEEIGRLADGN